jgi:hypothetical protein
MHAQGRSTLARPRADVFVSGCPGANGTGTFDDIDNRREMFVVASVDFESADMRSIGGVKSEITWPRSVLVIVQMRCISPSQ